MFTPEEIRRLAQEASSVAQDERGLTPDERELYELGWIQGFTAAQGWSRDPVARSRV